MVLKVKKNISHDYNKFPNELLDKEEFLLLGFGINNHDYEERVAKLIEVGAVVMMVFQNFKK